MIKETVITEKFCDFCGEEEAFMDMKTVAIGAMEFDVHDDCAVKAINHVFSSVAGWYYSRELIDSIKDNWKQFSQFKFPARFH